MDGNIFRKIEIQKLKILFVYDHVLREPDLFILKKALEYKNKFKKNLKGCKIIYVSLNRNIK